MTEKIFSNLKKLGNCYPKCFFKKTKLRRVAANTLNKINTGIDRPVMEFKN